ncbi:MAG: tetratricopeptide repeat protein [Terriglobia bacterium]|jgi:tetratricopeptide (TPR) repeat protein
MRKVQMLFIAMVLMVVPSLLAQGPPAMPLSEKELVDILKSKQQRPEAAKIVEQRGVGFELTPDIEKNLRKAKADDALIDIVKKAGPSERAARAAASGGAMITPEEGREMQALQGELDPDRMIQLAKDFEQKHPSSPLLTYVYVFEGTAYQQKSDLKQTVAACQKSLALKSDNLMALLVVTPLLPQPQLLQGVDPDKRLTEAENDAKTALKLIDALTAQANETPEQFTARKNTYVRDMNSAMGMIHLQRSMQSLESPDKDELAKAEQAYQIATTITPEVQPADYYRLGETRERLKKYPEAIEAYTKAGQLAAGTAIKTYADQRIEAIKKGLGQTK